MAHGRHSTVTVQDHCVVNDSKKHNRILSAHRNVGFSHKLSVSFKQRPIKVSKPLSGSYPVFTVGLFPVLVYLVERDSHFRIQSRSPPISSPLQELS